MICLATMHTVLSKLQHFRASLSLACMFGEVLASTTCVDNSYLWWPSPEDVLSQDSTMDLSVADSSVRSSEQMGTSTYSAMPEDS